MRDHETGKRSLFGPPVGTRPEGPVEIDCSRCGAVTAVSMTDALARVLRFSLWVPGRAHSRRLRCPACGRRAWVEVRLK